VYKFVCIGEFSEFKKDLVPLQSKLHSFAEGEIIVGITERSIFGILWDSLGFLGIPWDSLGFLGIPWDSLELLVILGIHVEFLKFRWNSGIP
jgi:hypothetical protein